MATHVPSEHSHLVVVIWQAFLGFAEQGKVLRNLLIAVRHLVQDKKGDETLPLGILCDFEGNVRINHPRQHPTDVALCIAH